ncbi:MAG: PAS domain S-box protein [Leptolyngbyaceae cyanobacterium]
MNHTEYLKGAMEEETPASSSQSLSLQAALDGHLLKVTPDTSLLTAITLMGQGSGSCALASQNPASDSAQNYAKRSSYVLVMEAEHLVGILTERDVVKLAAREIDLTTTSVAEVMTQELITRPESDLQDPFAVLGVLRKHRIRHLPIVNQGGHVVGVATPGSIRSVLQPFDLFKLRRVEEMMSTQVVDAAPESTVLNLAQLMATHRVSCVVITQPGDATPATRLSPIGIVTERDIVQFQALELNLSTLQAQAVMSTPLVCLRPEDSLWAAHQTMTRMRVRRLVVADAQGGLVGIVTQTSILAALDPLEMQKTVAALQHQVKELQDERIQWLQSRTCHLESQVQQSEERFRAIFNQTFQFIGLLEPDGTLIEANQTALDFGGLQREEVINRPFWEAHWWMISIEIQEQLKSAITRAAQGEFVRYEVDVLGVDRIATVDFSLRPLLDETGRVKLLIPEGRDISDRKQAEVALYQSEQRYASLAEAAPVGIFQTDAKGDCVYVNSRWCSIAGITVAAAMGKGWVESIHPEDRELVAAEWYRAAQAKCPFRLEYRFQTRMGLVTWVYGQAVAEIGPEGQTIGYIGTITDITERKEAESALKTSEARLNEAQQIAHIGSWELNLQTDTLLWSDEIYRIFEIDPQQFGATYEAFLSAVHPDDRVQVNQAYTDSVKKQTAYEITHRLRMSDGRIKHVHECGQTFYDSAGHPMRSLGTVQDVTARQQIEDALADQVAQAQLVAQISSRFSNLASAELDAGIRQTLQEVAVFTETDAGFMAQISSTDQTFQITHEWMAMGAKSHHPQPQNPPLSALPWMTDQIRQGQVMCIASLAELPTEAAMDKTHWQALGVHSLVTVPIRYQNHVMGWVSCASKRSHASCETPRPGQASSCFFKAIELLKTVGEIFAHALQRRHAEAALYQYQHHLEALVANRTAELQESEARFRTMADTTPMMIWVSDVDQRFTYFNQSRLIFTGRTLEQELDNGWAEGIHPEDFEAYRDTYLKAFKARQPFQMEYRLQRFDQEYRWMLDIAAPRILPNGEFAGYIGSCIDITERRRMAQELFREKELAQVTLHSIGDAVITTNGQGQVEYFNPVAERLTGWTAAAARGKPLMEVFRIVHEVTREPAENPVEQVLRDGCIAGLVNHTVLISRQGTEYCIEDSAAPIRDRAGLMIGTVMVFHDVTQSRQLSHRLSWQASHDALTDLTNRRQFEQLLEETLQEVQQSQEVHVLGYLDLDQFKVVNDTCGHAAGDELLRQVSQLLKSQIRATDILARLGGDEFGLLLKQCSLEQANSIAEKLREAVQNYHFLWQAKAFRIGVSIGLVALKSDSRTLSEVLSAADAACYAAKSRGRNRIHIYQADDSELAKQQGEQEWSVLIRQALEDNRFCLYRQAIVHTSHSDAAQIDHYEILVRMLDEQGEMIAPGVFIPAAERYKLMTEIDRWVVQKFFVHAEGTQPKQSPTSEILPETLHLINLSGASVGDAQFLDFLKAQFAQHNVSPHAIGFEITETAAIANLDQATHFINELKQLGCPFALDDFGSGMSSFGYLKTLPVDYLKIDGKFVRDIISDPATYAIVESINHVGHVMGLKTIAEWVENPELQDQLAQIGVDYLQGYGIARPCPVLLDI